MFVRQLIGQQAGQIIEMPFHAGEACISCGSAERVTDTEIAEANLLTAETLALPKADEMPPGYRVEEAEGGGYNVLDAGSVNLTEETEIPNLAAARSFAHDHYLADLEAAKQPEISSAAEGGSDFEPDWQDDWRDAHWATQVKLAKQFDPSVANKADAVAVLEAEEAKRAEAVNEENDGAAD